MEKNERKGIVSFKGAPMTLLGPEITSGKAAPDFTVVDKALKEVGLKDFSGKVKLISVTPSLDTGVCAEQLRRFNEQASRLGSDVAILNISMDLPFAISRFCSAEGIGRVVALSDYRHASFGTAYGVLIKELRLLARSVFVVSADDVVTYAQIVPEATNEVDFEAALGAAKSALTGRKKAVGE